MRASSHYALGLGLSLLLGLGTLSAAELRSDTLAAWDRYVQTEHANIERRAGQGGNFLWVDDDPARLARVERGEVIASPLGIHQPLRVAGGLIHHWIGAAFIPNARVDDVLTIARDYQDYPQYFHPNVDQARLLRQNADEDEFSIRFVNRSLLSKTALQGEYIADYTHLGDKRAFSESHATNMREIKSLGEPNEYSIPADKGSGYIWRLYSTTRIEERDGGVVIEMEALALSRDIPGTLRFIIEPIVRNVARDSLTKTLHQTASAVRGTAGVKLAESIRPR
jgi:hypothetical protein